MKTCTRVVVLKNMQRFLLQPIIGSTLLRVNHDRFHRKKKWYGLLGLKKAISDSTS